MKDQYLCFYLSIMFHVNINAETSPFIFVHLFS